MRNLFTLCLYIPLLLGALVSCRSAKQDTTSTTVVHLITTDTIVKERIVEVATPEDSARIKALLRCDSTGQVLLDWYEQECSKNAHLLFRLDSLGRMSAAFRTDPDTVFVTVADTTVNRREEQNEQQTVTVEVERQWTRWESYLHVCGLILNIGILLFVIYLFIKRRL